MAERKVYRRAFQLPENGVYIGRPSKWGNPYRVEVYGRRLAIKLFSDTLNGIWSNAWVPAEMFDATYALHRAFLERIGPHPLEAARSELKGKDLYCWCKATVSCHGDILIKAVNE